MKNLFTKILVLLFVISLNTLSRNGNPPLTISPLVCIHTGICTNEIISQRMKLKNCACPEDTQYSKKIHHRDQANNSPASINKAKFLSGNVPSNLKRTPTKNFKNIKDNNVGDRYTLFIPGNLKLNYSCIIITGFDDGSRFFDNGIALSLNEKSNNKI